ncbi:defense protein l(2)34Fc [Drosophila sulfurigaster albostrigata]|uniref:Defense protein l(2)34Fc n=1 Tax=Drosophila albomicans TaxID=7291 RepID=A0A6P8WJE5_DROAB|nr:defense protein l(2)34Fc [Drosophila albomicans]XP_060666405.1 defense protein l(2)34Fc [Drosophila nasuta]XP_060666406.1 defense protein l(2)34Fc [Drosophila nasuta]XP_062142972.1 defense protein l(2)34Fc [Drosophila sulfurigaster albostrigata]XP_062142973.1 defense protein l(2)34Fc [Drosophila sulfurigaster albostrigata]
MFRLLLIAVCLAASAHAYSEGAPKVACGDLTPQHGAQLQTKKPPYSISGSSHVRNSQKLTLTLGGDEFMGFIIQARDGQNRVVGQFKVVDTEHSQTLDCSGPQDTLTHLNAKKGSPLSGLTFEWIPPAGYTGNVKFMASVVQSSFVYWVGRVTKDVTVEA